MQASEQDHRYHAARRVTVIGAVVNLVLSALKIGVGYVGQSQSLIADGIHSLSDLVTDVLVLFAAKHGSRHADQNHPYGHARIETVATFIVGLLLVVVGLGIIISAGERLLNPDLLLHPGWLALSIAMLSVLGKEALYHYTIHVAKQIRSNLLRANAWHHRSDAISSVVVMIGIGGVMAGLPYLDAIAAIAVALMIGKMGWDLGWHSIQELIDRGLEPERVEEIRAAILAVDGVRDLHLLRTRRMGADALIDVHILVDSKLSISEGHQIGDAVHGRLVKGFDEITDVTIHIDPENDDQIKRCAGLPLRNVVMQKLRERWRDIGAAAQIERVTLHYLGGRIHVEIVLPFSSGHDPQRAESLAARLREAALGVDEVAQVEVYYT